jgi:hypothetical protein
MMFKKTSLASFKQFVNCEDQVIERENPNGKENKTILRNPDFSAGFEFK